VTINELIDREGVRGTTRRQFAKLATAGAAVTGFGAAAWTGMLGPRGAEGDASSSGIESEGMRKCLRRCRRRDRGGSGSGGSGGDRCRRKCRRNGSGSGSGGSGSGGDD
jgi:hypothetical protein